MLQFAIGELGLKPWELDDMTLQEYHLCAQGYFIRMDKEHAALRNIYAVIWNANAPKGHRIRNQRQLHDHWPLSIDKESRPLTGDEWEEKKRVFREQQQLSAKHGTGRA